MERREVNRISGTALLCLSMALASSCYGTSDSDSAFMAGAGGGAGGSPGGAASSGAGGKTSGSGGSAGMTNGGGGEENGAGTAGTGNEAASGGAPAGGAPAGGESGAPSGGVGGESGGGASGEPGSGGVPAGGNAGSGSEPVAGAGGAGAPDCGNTIDDMEDGDGLTCIGSGRGGHWFAWNTGGTIYPPMDTPFDAFLLPAARGSSTYGMNFTGAGVTMAGIGLLFHTITWDNAVPFDAGAYTGIEFYARTTASISISVAVHTYSTEQTAFDGSCTLGAGCIANESGTLSVGSVWVKYQVPFTSLTGGSSLFDESELMSLHIKTAGNASGDFDLWIDDPAFY